MSKMKYIATLSGGKDSTVMCDLLLKNNYQVDYIVFSDTLDEFDEMYSYIDKLDEYFKSRYNKTITRLKPKKTYDDFIFKIRAYGERVGELTGLPTAMSPFCEWRRDAKIAPFEKWAKQFKHYKVYIGITIDEQDRTKRDDEHFLYPLIDNFQMSERDCKEYLIEQEMENPLYRHFNRTGCKKCFYQSEKDFFNIWKYYPKVWAEMKEYEKRVQEHPKAKEENKYWFTGFRTCNDMEQMFIKADKQGSLFDFSDEPLKDCFCKI